MIDHIGIAVSDYARSVRFYREALAPLGYELSLEVAGWAGFGVAGKPDFWIAEQPNVTRTHTRPEYHADYYRAFVLHPDGHNVESVCHTSEA